MIYYLAGNDPTKIPSVFKLNANMCFAWLSIEKEENERRRRELEQQALKNRWEPEYPGLEHSWTDKVALEKLERGRWKSDEVERRSKSLLYLKKIS